MSKARRAGAVPAAPTVDVVANHERGEHELVLAGAKYLLRPSHDAARRIEKKTDKAIIELFRASNAGSLKNDQAAAICGELIRAGATDDMTRFITDDRIGELIYEEGLPPVLPIITLVLLDMATGGRTASGEAKVTTTIGQGLVTGA